MKFRVSWEIDVEADTTKEAAELAREMQDNHTTATLFTVESWNTGEKIVIDLPIKENKFK